MVSSARPARKITPTSPSPSPEPAPGSVSGSAKTEANVAASVPSQTSVVSIAHSDTTRSQVNTSEERTRLDLEAKIRAVVDLLYQLAVCAADVQPGSEHFVGRKVNECTRALAELDNTKVNIKALIPHDVIEMLDVGKNPDIHTRNFINRLASENQYSYGQHLAMLDYHNQLNQALDDAFPELAQPHSQDT